MLFDVFNLNSFIFPLQELLKRCQQCMDTIVHAKERQAAEANKNASSLLELIDEERRNEETKKVIYFVNKSLNRISIYSKMIFL